MALGDLLTLLKRRRPHEILMVNELARVAFDQLDRHYVPKLPTKKIRKIRPKKV